MTRTFIVGLDGVSHEGVLYACRTGRMPALARWAAGGVLRRSVSTLPPLSSVAWSSVLTGVGPETHGIFGFVDVDPATYRYTFPSVQDLAAPPLWELLARWRGRGAYLNVPATYPAPPVNGVLVSGFVAPVLERAVWPRELAPDLAREGYRVDVDARLAQGDIDAFLEDLARVLEGRMRLVRRVWAMGSWDVFMAVFTGTDRLLHFCHDALYDGTHPLHHRVWGYLRRVDAALDEILALAREDDLVILLSDHGFGDLRREVHTNAVLEALGYAAFREPDAADLTALAPGSRAFALDPGRVVLNRRTRFAGGVDGLDARACEALADALAQWAAREGVGATVRLGADLYAGPHAGRAPDILVTGSGGDDWKGRVGAAPLAAPGVFTGCHVRDNAFMLVRAPFDVVLPDTVDLTWAVRLVKRMHGPPDREDAA